MSETCRNRAGCDEAGIDAIAAASAEFTQMRIGQAEEGQPDTGIWQDSARRHEQTRRIAVVLGGGTVPLSAVIPGIYNPIVITPSKGA